MIKVWDPLVRIFHWSLASFFFLAYYLQGDWLGLHSHAGYTAALLVGFRLVWGVIGPEAVRFSSFVVAPNVVIAYLRQFVIGRAGVHAGHDPAGAIMILVLLAAVLATAFSGMSLFALEGSGPLAGTFVTTWSGVVLQDVHEFAADFTLYMVVAHVAGVLVTSLLQRQNLVAAMITGSKKVASKTNDGQGLGS